MNNQNDVIVIDLEKFPHLDNWGTKLGGHLGLEYFYLEDEYFDYIPQYVNYLRFSSKEGTLGSKYWGEARSARSEYAESEEGTTQKDKVSVDNELVRTYTIPFMKSVIRLKVQEIFEKRYNELRTKYSVLEDATWQDQLSESKTYLEDETTAVTLINRLAEIRGLTIKEFATIVVEKQTDWKTKLHDLAVQEQTILVKIKECFNVADVNVFLEDYFGIEMSSQQCLEFNRCEKNDETGLITRKDPFKYGLRF